ncbi:MAG: hypothetical protein ACD_30C00112G0090 [uncultured bacterium]|uniref:Uncharacterized protein n=2 Tax=Candidatus Daviesiibacteriota TaxID=1752718 RepID=A0A1F5K5M7_9BACT|nr:MAG: hypothetical protein ACD_30C00112G0090 [uncultured bacterium]OGE17249.1 MAG: hypothetical protein A2858_00915 [Candidatus Daviesbacteria bacterium RIFCSPHIGHO2_01_FULL_36_37]OGE36030.1 MAG: hypothetical protein A3E66_01910 [Candidatus Daviesbacteria bacterium RIFCSPHIGHO2_12_FULL_37_16]
MSTFKPQAHERSGATATLPNPYEASEERDPGFALEDPKNGPNYSNVGEQFDVTYDYWNKIKENSLDLYKPSIQELVKSQSPESPVSKAEFKVAGELKNNWKEVRQAGEAVLPFTSTSNETKAPSFDKNSFITSYADKKDGSKGKIFGFIVKGLGDGLAKIGKFGIDIFNASKKTFKEANTKTDTRTDEQKAEEVKERQKRDTIAGNISRIDNAQARVVQQEQEEIMGLKDRLGVVVDHNTEAQMMGENWNASAKVDNIAAVHEVSRAFSAFMERQKKQADEVEERESGFNMSEGEMLKGGENMNHFTKLPG